MPKRKRPDYEDGGDRVQYMRTQDVQDKVTQSKKLLHRALKTAKGFERQKLGKRLKNATTEKKSEDIARTNREIEALKALDLGKITDAYLNKTLLKIKAFAESGLLPDEIRQAVPKPEGTEEMMAALHNVTSGMYNMKPVKDAMAQILNGMYIAMGIPAPSRNVKHFKKDNPRDTLNAESLRALRNGNSKEEESTRHGNAEQEPDDASWDGFNSDGESNSGNMEGKGDIYESLDEEEFSHYDGLIGGSSDEESFDEEPHVARTINKEQHCESLSLSPTPSTNPSPAESPSSSPSLSPEPEPRPKTNSKPRPALTKPGSTFLPTLMGGYWSGTESDASDIEESAPPVKKNRPGQMARRAIWEKKFGEKANHITSGQGAVGKSKGKDDGWDSKRGAKDISGGRGRGRGIGAGGGGQRASIRNYGNATGENSIPVEPKTRSGKRDDVGVLHPSWQAAKKAKDMKKTATFQGKKVTFD